MLRPLAMALAMPHRARGAAQRAPATVRAPRIVAGSGRRRGKKKTRAGRDALDGDGDWRPLQHASQRRCGEALQRASDALPPPQLLLPLPPAQQQQPRAPAAAAVPRAAPTPAAAVPPPAARRPRPPPPSPRYSATLPLALPALHGPASWLSFKRRNAEERQCAPLRVRLPTGCLLSIELGDLTLFEGDAIVNAANSSMLGGGGVDGAIHAAAGPELYRACLALPLVAPGVRCPTGEARITSGGRLAVRHVIHAVGPVYRDARSSNPLLAAAYAYSVSLAQSDCLQNIAFPAISCGIFGYPHAEAAPVAMRVFAAYTHELSQVHVIIADRSKLGVWRDAALRVGVQEPAQADAADEAAGRGF